MGADAEAGLICRLARRELFRILRPGLSKYGVKLGRGRFSSVLRGSPPPLEKPPSFTPRTANSRRYLPVFHNPAKGMVLTGRNQAGASGITRIRSDGGFLYLALISDMRPRKIAGRHAGNTLEAPGALAALKKAVAALGEGGRHVRHAGRGCQYCGPAYAGGLQSAA
jgi:hypothetical protein